MPDKGRSRALAERLAGRSSEDIIVAFGLFGSA